MIRLCKYTFFLLKNIYINAETPGVIKIEKCPNLGLIVLATKFAFQVIRSDNVLH